MIDISFLWREAHSHLVPRHDVLENGFVTHEACPVCGVRRALTVQARLYEADETVVVPVYHCDSCNAFSLSSQTINAFQHKAFDLDKVLALDARLWFRTQTFLNLEPTTRCNLECWYCVGRHMPQADIVESDFLAILEHFPDLKTLALVGEGEPLMHKGFFSMAELARSRGVQVVIVSNGTTFSSSNIEKICASGVVYISVSIDSHREDAFSSSRIGGSLEKVLANIRNLVSYREQHGYRYPRIGLKGTIFHDTLGEVPEIARLAKESGVDVFEGFQPLNPMRTYVPIYPHDKLDELRHLNMVREDISRGGKLALNYLTDVATWAASENLDILREGRPNGTRPNCDEAWIYSLLNGDVTPCCQIKSSPSRNWNLISRDLADIQTDPDYENWRFNLWNGLFDTHCQGCWKTSTDADLSKLRAGDADTSV